MNLQAIIVDDEKHSRETLRNLISEFCKGVTIVKTASTIDEAIAAIQFYRPDLVFLDIELQTGTGFDVLEQIPQIDFEVIFTTAFEQYALKAVKFSSLDYLLKPVDITELQNAVEKAKEIKDKNIYNKQLETLLHNLNQQQPDNNKICLSTADGYEFIGLEEIIYCKAEGSYTAFKLLDGTTLLVSKHLKEYESLLSQHHFMRVHNSFLINLQYVKKYVKTDGGYILMSNGDAVGISRNRKDDFFKIMNLT